MTTTIFKIAKRVYLDDTDAFGMMYHGAHVRFFEQARSEWLLQSGLSFQDLIDQKTSFVARSLHINYLKPIKLNTLINITATISKTRKTCLTFQQTIIDQTQPELIYCTGQVEVVMINHQGHPQRIPHHILEALL